MDPAELRELAHGSWGEKARALFAESLPGTDWVWKDPRTCLLLPFWREVLGDDLVIVAVVRNPLESARSLEARDEIPVPYGTALWERYQRSAILGSDSLPVLVVGFDALLADPHTTWDHLAEFLGMNGIRVDPESGRQEAVRFLDRGLRHQQVDAEVADQLTPQQAELYSSLLQGVGVVSGDWRADLPPESAGLQLAFDEHRRLSHHRDLADQLRNGLDEVRAGFDREIDRLWGEIHRLERELDDAVEGRRAVVEALERALVVRDEWKAHAEWLSQRWPLRVRRWFSQVVNGRHS